MRNYISTAAVAAFFVLYSFAAIAQTPQITQTVPADSFLGEPFCFETEFTNSGDTGFGPYLRLVLPPELIFDSATIFGGGAGINVVGVFALPDNELIDPIIGEPVVGPEGSTLIILSYPVGSVVDGGPPLPVEICLTIDLSAEVGTPLPIEITPVYQFGDTATGANGPIIAAPVTQNVTPTVLLFEKTDGAPESERPPGPSWPYEYDLTVDIANTATINPLVISDILPPNFQFVGPINITGGVGCSVTQTPSLLAPGGALEVICTGDTVGTLSDADVVISYSGFIVDVLDETNCGTAPQINNASAEGTYVPSAGASQVLPPVLSSNTVTAKHIAVQKSVSPAAVIPGAVLTYTLNFQVSDFGTGSSLVVTDTLPDGILFVAHNSLLVNGVAVGITPTTTGNGDSTTTLVYDVGAVAGSLPAGTDISLSYEASLSQEYLDTGLPVLSSDSLSNSVSIVYGLDQGATACGDTSAATIEVNPVSVSKEIVNVQPFYVPGDQVQFRLTLNVPTGDTSDIVFEDFLPLPVFEAGDVNLTFGTDIELGPDDTAGLTPTSITSNLATNSIRIEWPDLSSTTPEVIQVDLFATVSDTPFADGLFQTNILSVSTSNTVGSPLIGTGPISFGVGAPDLVITKGISATDGAGTIAPPPATLPVDGNIVNVDADDQITYVITVENTGLADAFDIVVTDPLVPGLSACVVDSVEDGTGTPLATTGDLQTGLALTDPLDLNDQNPANGGAPYSSDTALITVICDVDDSASPNSDIVNTASVEWASLPGAELFPPQTDDATATTRNIGQQKFFVTSSESGTSNTTTPPRLTVGEIVRYRLAVRLTEGQITNLNIRDNLPGGLQYLNDGSTRAVIVSNQGGVTVSGLPGITNVSGNTANPTGANNVPSDLSWTAVTSISGGPFNNGTDPIFGFGTVTNNDDDADNEFLLVEFNAVVLNVGGVNSGGTRDNNFTSLGGTAPLAGNSNNVRIQFAEPVLGINKSVTPTTADADDVVSFTLTVANATGANISPAYDVLINDPLPTGLNAFNNIVVTPTGCPSSGLVDTSTATEIDIAVAVMAPGCSIEITFDSTLLNTVAPGVDIVNTANAVWTSLPGLNGTAAGSNPTGSVNPGTPGTNTGERTGAGGAVNDYDVDGVATIVVPGVGIEKTLSVVDTSEPETGDGEFRPGIPDLVIGEQATFIITVTVPEGTTPQLLVEDTVPFGNGVMRLDSAEVTFEGADLTIQNSLPIGGITDDQLMDGVNDTVLFDFGQVSNNPDNDVDVDDQIIIQVTGTLIDNVANVNGDELTNTVQVQFGLGLSDTASAEMDVVEPLLEINKLGDITDGDAGDLVNFTVTINHSAGSTADAQDLVFEDVLPSGLVLVPGSVQVTSGPVFDVNTSAGNTITLGWTDLAFAPDPGEIIVLEYQATLANSVNPSGEVINIGSVDWTSIAGPSADERSNDVDDSHTINVTEPGLVKAVIDTSEPTTMDSELTIGEQVTYQFTVLFPEGTSNDAVVTDQLPINTSVLEVVSSRVVSVGGNLMGTPALPAVGTAGTESDTNADTFNDLVTWNLGQVLNTPDGSVDVQDEITFEVVAVVLDQPLNQSGVNDQLNVATLTTSTTTISGSAPIDIVAPEVEIRKSVTDPADGFIDAGDTVTVLLEIDHTADSTADAFNLAIIDTLPVGLSWAGNGSVVSTCAGLVTDSSGEPVIEFTLDTLDLTTDICTIEYQVTVDNTVLAAQTLSNIAVLNYDSTPVVVTGQTRTQSDSASADVTVTGPGLLKAAISSSLPDTGMAQGNPGLMDLTIGETVTYELTLTFPEGVTSNAVLTDLMPIAPGVIEATGAEVFTIGGNIDFSQKPIVSLVDNELGDGLNDTVTIEFGNVTNTPDPNDGSVNDLDRVVVRIVGRVADVPANVDGLVLSNDATLNFDGDGGMGLTGSASIDVVEPETNLSKNMTLGADGLVTITLSIENTGTAPAFNLRVEDVLDEAVWDLSAFNAVSVPAGFNLNLLPATPGAGQQTVELVSDPAAVSPAGTIPVSSTVAAVFEVQLAVLPPVPNPLINTADQTGGSSLPGNDPDGRVLPPDSAQAPIAVPQLVLIKDDELLFDNDESGSVSPGDTLRYTLTMQNIGAAAATNIVIDDTPDANTALVVGSVTTTAGGTVSIGNTAGDVVVQVVIPSLAAASTVTITYETLIDDPLASGVTQLVNQAVFDSTQLPPGSSDDPDPPGTDDPTIVPIGDAFPDLTISKDDGGVTAAPGDTVVWTLSYENIGNQDATGVVITDTVPDNTVFDSGASSVGWACLPDFNAGSVCTIDIGDVAVGDTGSVLFAVVIDSPLPAGVEEVVNTASIADDGSNGPDPTPGNNSDGDNTPIIATPDLTIVKDDGGITAVPGGLVVYTLDYQNVGDQDATGVEITDIVPPNTTFVIGSSTAGWACAPDNQAGSSCVISIGDVGVGEGGNVLFAVQLDDPLPLDFDLIPNTAVIGDDGSNGPDPTPDDNESSVTTPVNIAPALGIVKELTDAPDPITAGSLLEYTITSTNIGNMTLTNLVVTDNLITPTGGTTPCAIVAPGGICTLIGTYVVTPLDVENGQVLNVATADSDQTDPVGTELTVPVAQNPAIDLVKEAVLDDTNGNELGDAGEVINYILTTTNIGDVTLTNVVVIDSLLDNLVCVPAIPATLAPTETIVCTGSLVIQTADLTSGAINNVATASGEGPGGTPVDDGDSTITPLNAPMAVPTLSIWALLMLSLMVLILGAGTQLRRS